MKIQSNNVLLSSQQKSQKLTMEYETLSRQYTEQREKMLSQIVTGLLDVFNFQQHISNQLVELKNQMEEDQNLTKSLSNTLM
jgi:kinetochore protein NDC80